MYRKNKGGEWGCLLAYVLTGALYSAQSGSWVFAGIYFGVALVPIVIVVVSSVFKEVLVNYRSRTQKCPHGIAGGELNNKCSFCVYEHKQMMLEQENRIRKAKLEREKKAQLLDFKAKAQSVRMGEAERVTQDSFKKIEYLRALSPREFEDFTALLYRKLGYTVRQTPYSNDGGRDLIIYKNEKKYLVECKKYSSSNLVGRPELQKFFAAVELDQAESGYIITTSGFTKNSIEHPFVRQGKIQLIDHKKLSLLVREAFPEDFDNHVMVACEECGDETCISFDEISRCVNGHNIGPVSYNDLVDIKVVTRKKNQKRYRTRKPYKRR